MTIPYTFTRKNTGKIDGQPFTRFEMRHDHTLEISEYRKKTEIAKWLKKTKRKHLAIKRRDLGFHVELTNGRKLILTEVSVTQNILQSKV